MRSKTEQETSGSLIDVPLFLQDRTIQLPVFQVLRELPD